MEYISNLITDAQDWRRASKAAVIIEAKIIGDIRKGIINIVSLADPYTAIPPITRNKDLTALRSVQRCYCRKFMGFLVFSHTPPPRNRHQLLNRLYIPSQGFIVEQERVVPKDQHVPEQARWIGFDIKDFVFKEAEDDLFTLFEEMMGKPDPLGKPDGLIITDYPNRLDLPRVFVMEMRGYFKDDDDLIAAVKQHIDIVEKLVRLDFLVLEDDVIARPGFSQSEELDFRVLYTRSKLCHTLGLSDLKVTSTFFSHEGYRGSRILLFCSIHAQR